MNSDQFEVLWSCVSKLESQIERDQSLPEAYKALVGNGFAVLRNLAAGVNRVGGGCNEPGAQLMLSEAKRGVDFDSCIDQDEILTTMGLLRAKLARMVSELRSMEYKNDDDGVAWSLGSSAADDLELYLMDASDEH